MVIKSLYTYKIVVVSLCHCLYIMLFFFYIPM